MSALHEFLQSRQNPVLQRELRVALRNVRTFMLLAIYVSVLGSIVLAQFPAEASLTVPGEGAQSTGTLGRKLFWNFMGAQLLLVWALVPLLSTGALAQERERHTLEPLLLSPLTPLQIVWGKAAGVLSLMMLLLLGTLPLTSLCFLLGGVSPGELVGGYCVLLALSLVFTGVGLYAAAKWHSPVRAVLYCYLILGMCLPVILLAVAFGSIPVGLFIIGWLFHAGWRALKKWSQQSRHSGAWGWRACLFLGMAIPGALILLFWRDSSFSQLVIYALFIAPCLVYIAFLPMHQAAVQLSRLPAQQPRTPTREWMDAMHTEWQRAVVPPPQVYIPDPTGRFTYSPQVQVQQAQAQTAAPQTVASRSPLLADEPTIPLRNSVPTYGVKSFLPDHLNPVFARDLRAGIAGKSKYFFRFSYIVVIATEVLLLLHALVTLSSPAYSAQDVSWFLGWGRLHLFMLMIGGTWLGARAIAPEREKQVLPQLLSTPLTASTVVAGKMMAVAVYTFYIFVLGVPLALMLPPLGLVSWNTTLYFLLVELVCATLAASWGIYCSLQGVTARRALGLALGGILALLLGGSLMRAAIEAQISPTSFSPGPRILYALREIWSPLGLLDAPDRMRSINSTAASFSSLEQNIALVFYLVLSAILLLLAVNTFRRYTRSL